MALVHAQDRDIAGAGLGGFEVSRYPSIHPSGPCRMFVISHYAGSTPYYEERTMRIYLDNLQRYRAGEPLCSIVDKKLRY